MGYRSWLMMALWGACVAGAASVDGVTGRRVIAEWDFTSGSIHSVDGRFRASPRGVTAIAGTGDDRCLAVGLSPSDRPEGLQLLERYPALTPEGAFGVECQFRLREPTSSQRMLLIWDSKNIMYAPEAPKPHWHCGFSFALWREDDVTCYPVVWLGHGSFSSFYRGKKMRFPERSRQKLSFEFDGQKTVTFIWNGKKHDVCMSKKGGKLAPPCYPMVIGDRSGSSYNRFDGELIRLQFFAPEHGNQNKDRGASD